jgi:hypothetical protein
MSVSVEERQWRVASEKLESLAKDIRKFMHNFIYDPRGPSIPWCAGDLHVENGLQSVVATNHDHL